MTVWSASLTLKSIRYFNSSGLGRLVRSSSLSVTSADPNSSRRIAASMTCCSRLHLVSAEMMTGYGELMKAYFLMALHIDRTETEEVSVTRWYATGSTSPSCTSTTRQVQCIRVKNRYSLSTHRQSASKTRIYPSTVLSPRHCSPTR